MKKLEKEEKEEYQPYAWNKKKEKYVPVGKPQPSLNLCKECLSTLSKFSKWEEIKKAAGGRSFFMQKIFQNIPTY